jgi:hypothetical protein
MTHGSIKGDSASSSLGPKYDVAKETKAAPNKILTKISSNYSLIFSHMDSPSSSGSSFKPYFKNFC